MATHRGSTTVATAALLLACACGRSSSSPPAARAMPGATWQSAVEVAVGPAHRGPWRMNASDFRWVDDPSVEVASNGEIVVVWVDQSRKDVFLQRYASNGAELLAEETLVSMSPATFSWLPRVRVATEDPSRVYVLWQEIVFSGGSHGGEILFARSRDGGRSFDPPTNLSGTPAGDGKGRLDAKTWDNGSLDLVRGPGGELYAAWTEYEGALWLRRGADDGATFSAPLRVAGTATLPARGPSLAVGRDGAVHIAWATGEDPRADIRYAVSTDQGRTFGGEGVVVASESHSDAPSIAVDSRGTVHLFYDEGADEVRYSRKARGQRAFEPPRRLFRDASFPHVSIDGRDRIHVVWEEPRGLAFSSSTDGGAHFAPAARVPAAAAPRGGVIGSQQGKLGDKLAVGESGSIAIVNSTFVPGEASEVVLVRGRLAY